MYLGDGGFSRPSADQRTWPSVQIC